MSKLIITLIMITSFTAVVGQRIKVACVGNSVTYGYGLPNPATDAYPAQLQKLLGDAFDVRNFGRNGATLMHGSGTTYRLQNECKRALAFAPDYVVIELGLNDVDPMNWTPNDTAFTRDYRELIDAFRRVNPRCRIWICHMTPIAYDYPNYFHGLRERYAMIRQKIADVARETGASLIDLREPFRHRLDLLFDGLHPNAEGARLLAATIGEALTGRHGGLCMPAIYTDHMVLQRGRPIKIEGTADAGETVTVRIADRTHSAQAAADGRWLVTLDAMPAATGLTLEVATPKRKLRFDDVAVGDVWLCSGQSNMAYPTDSVVPAERAVLRAFAKTHPAVRLFLMQPSRIPFAEEWEASMLDSLNRLEYFLPARWEQCDKSTVGHFSAIAMAFAKRIQETENVPIGLILNAVDGSPLEAWIDRETLEADGPEMLSDFASNVLIHPWVRSRTAFNLRRATSNRQRHPYAPTYLFETGVWPLAQLPIRGVLWYQGESNAHDAAGYARFFPLLVSSWRRYFSDATLPFYFVQISTTDKPDWGRFRDMQRRLPERVPACYMAISSDRGDSIDIHFPHKIDVGERLARQALYHSYGHTDVIADGPIVERAVQHDGRVTVYFRSAADLITSDRQPVRTVELADAEGPFYPATVEIIEDRLSAYSPHVPRPHRVRYGWASFNRANLTNGAGLPASTFSVDVEQEGKP